MSRRRLRRDARLLDAGSLSLYVILSILIIILIIFTSATFTTVLFCVTYVFFLFVVLVRLSVPVQMIDWKDLSLRSDL